MVIISPILSFWILGWTQLVFLNLWSFLLFAVIWYLELSQDSLSPNSLKQMHRHCSSISILFWENTTLILRYIHLMKYPIASLQSLMLSDQRWQFLNYRPCNWRMPMMKLQVSIELLIVWVWDFTLYTTCLNDGLGTARNNPVLYIRKSIKI